MSIGRPRAYEVWDDYEQEWIVIGGESAPSAEDEYFASLEPGEPEHDGYELDIIFARSKLTRKQLFAIECRYGFRGPEMTLEQIATLMGTDRAAVYRLIERGLANLRKATTKMPISRGHNVSRES